ncbi:MAG: hypothetical protein Q9225_007488, partial [Loekoesia sp. 1 TL-2023]
HFEADPEDIPGLAASILTHLQLLPSRTPAKAPQPLTPALFPFPWLWDVSSDAIAHKESSKPPDQEWNWDLLAHQLSQPDLHDPGAVLANLPMGLRNRRRIWRIVEDMLSVEGEEYYEQQLSV